MVSHGTEAILIISRMMVMNHGRVITIDEPGEAIRAYLADLLGVGTLEGSDSGGVEGNVFAIGTVQAEHGGSGSRPHMYPGESLTIVADVDSFFGHGPQRVLATIAIHSSENDLVFASDPDDPACELEIPEGGGVVRFLSLPRCLLLDGTYSVSVGIRSATETAIFDWKDQVTQLRWPTTVDPRDRLRWPLDVSFRLRSAGATGEVPIVSGAQFAPLAGWEESAS